MPSAHHVGVTVADLNRAVAFYRDVFDFSVLTEFSVAGEGFSTGVDVPNATGDFAHLDADGLRLELVEYDPEGAAAHADRVNQPGAKHFGVEVDDVDDFYRTLSEDVQTLSPPQTTDSGTRILFVVDPEGNLVEVLAP
jgi:catechol 2,3-dioxygenase-like lactoylglutathione lyase family enzyme